MQLELEDVQALADVLDKVLGKHAAAVASLQSLKDPDSARVEAESALVEIGLRDVLNPACLGQADLRAMAVLAERCGEHMFHGSFWFHAVIGGHLVAHLPALPSDVSAQAVGDGSTRVTVPLTETGTAPGVRAEPAAGGRRLHGMLPVVPYAAESTHVLVPALGEGGEGIHFLIALDAPGLHCTAQRGLDGTPLGHLQLDAVAVEPSAMVGGAPVGQTLLEGEQHATLLLCFEAVGLMNALLRKTTEFLQVRKQLGKPLGTFQALQHRMVGVLLMLEQTRSAAQLALDALCAGSEDRAVRLSAAKHAVGVYGQKVAEECIQLHGGIGMTWEMEAAHCAKRLVLLDHYFGNADHHLSQVMAAI